MKWGNRLKEWQGHLGRSGMINHQMSCSYGKHVFQPLLKNPVFKKNQSFSLSTLEKIETLSCFMVFLGPRNTVATKVVAADLTKDVLFGNAGGSWPPAAGLPDSMTGKQPQQFIGHFPIPDLSAAAWPHNVKQTIIPSHVWKLGTLKTTEFENHRVIIWPSLKPTYIPWKLVVGRLLSSWENLFSPAMSVLGGYIGGDFGPQSKYIIRSCCMDHAPIQIWNQPQESLRITILNSGISGSSHKKIATALPPSATLHLFARANGPAKTWAQKSMVKHWKSHGQLTQDEHIFFAKNGAFRQLALVFPLGFGGSFSPSSFKGERMPRGSSYLSYHLSDPRNATAAATRSSFHKH